MCTCGVPLMAGKKGAWGVKQRCKASLFDESAFDWFGWWAFFLPFFYSFLSSCDDCFSYLHGFREEVFFYYYFIFFISIIIIIAADWLCVGVYTYFCLFLQPFFCFKGDMLIFFKTTFSFVSFPVLRFFPFFFHF